MVKKFAVLVCAVFVLTNIYGCFLLLAGAAGGTGTAVWLSGKLAQEFNASYERTVKAAESALDSLGLTVTKKTVSSSVAQLISSYTDGKTIWVDVRRITSSSTKVEVRVGRLEGDKEVAGKILDKIKRYL